MNWFVYCNNSPLVYTDPSGLNPNAVALLQDSGGSGYYEPVEGLANNPQQWGYSQLVGNNNSSDDQNNSDDDPSDPSSPVVAPSVQTIIDNAQDGINQLRESAENFVDSAVAVATGLAGMATEAATEVVDKVISYATTSLLSANNMTGSILTSENGNIIPTNRISKLIRSFQEQGGQIVPILNETVMNSDGIIVRGGFRIGPEGPQIFLFEGATESVFVEEFVHFRQAVRAGITSMEQFEEWASQNRELLEAAAEIVLSSLGL